MNEKTLLFDVIHYHEKKNMIKQYIKHLLFLLTFVVSLSITAQAQQGTDYNTTLKSADEYYQNKDYYNAKAAYQLASKINPDEAYPKEKIAEIISLLKAEMAVRGEYDEYIELADEAFALKDYALAIVNYEKALVLIEYESHPKQQLEESKKLQEAAQLKQGKYLEAIKSADLHFANQEYEEALSFYRNAANVDDEQKYPNDQILKINSILQNNNANQLAYEQAIVKADQQLNYQKFKEALAQYEAALSIKPQDNYANTQIVKMKDFIEKEKEYDRIAAQADDLYVKKDFIAAKTMYEKAQRVLPEKTYALNMISKIDASLDEEQKKLAKNEADYQKAILEGDALFKEKKYQVAYSKYTKALDMKPNEEYPKNQIFEIDILLATGYFELSCFVHENNRGLFDSRIQLLEGGRVVETAEIGTNGRHKMKLELNHEYQIKFYKSDYVQKIFDINTALPRDVNHNNIFEYDLVVELFQSCSTDLSIFDNPLTEIVYHKSKGNFFYDEDRARVVINKVTALKKDCKEILAKEEKRNEYDQEIVKADKYFAQEDYTKSIENYTVASTILPTMEYPKQKIAEIQTILESADKYQALIISGDAKYKAKDYENALYDYYAAKNLKPKETYPPEKIAEIDGIINAQKLIDHNFLVEIAKADSLYQMDSLNMAIDSYRSASSIKPEENYPKNQIAKIEQELKSRKELDKRYKDAIANADKLFEAEKLNDAKSAYLVASQIKPNEMYPKYKVEDINTIEEQRRIMALNDNYATVLLEADQLFEKSNYSGALPLYERAAEIKPKESYPPAQIEKINVLLAQLKADDTKYNSLIASADKKLAAKEYALAFDDYKLALLLKPTEQYPQDKMAEIEAIMKQLADLELAYQQAIQLADSQFDSQQWNVALASYTEASSIKQEEPYPQQRIREINGILQGISDNDAAYNAAISEGDKHYNVSEWAMSLSSFQRALNLRNTEEYPQAKITEIQGIIKKLEDTQAAYDAAIASADELFNLKTYVEAKSYYIQAVSIISTEEYPKERITEIDILLQQMADKDALYAQLIESGDGFFNEENYQKSLGQFQQALQIKNTEEYPAQKIKEIEGILGAIAEKDRLYDEAIMEADKNTEIKAYPLAIEKYTEAVGIKPNEQYPKDKIAELEALMKSAADLDLAYQELIQQADQQYETQEWSLALSSYQKASNLKPEEVYPKDKMAEINRILQEVADNESAYSAAIAEADRRFESSEWALSLTSFQRALELKPKEEYPQTKIAEIQGILKGIEETQAAYNAAIASADELFNTKSYIESKSYYQQALSIISTEEYPQKRMREIDALLQAMADKDALYAQLIESGDAFFSNVSYQQSMDQFKQALQVKPAEEYPAQKIKEIEGILMAIAEKDRLYTEVISEADKNRDMKAYPLAIEKYTEASGIKPNEQYPIEQVSLIQALLADITKQQNAYDDLLAQADAKFDQEQWQDALGLYHQSLEIKATEVHPQTRIKEIESILQKIAENNAAYNKAIQDADAFYKAKTWSEALTNYEVATQLKPEEEYPKKKIAELKAILGDIASAQAKYDAFITEADLLFTELDYTNSKTKYQQALEIKSTETYPQQKMSEIDAILAKMAADLKQYNLLIKEADKLFVKEEWTPALEKYQAALAIKSEEVYPQEQINIINEKIQEIANQQAAYDALVAEADQFFNTKDYDSALLKYEAALAILSDKKYPKERMSEIRDILEELARKNAEYTKIIEKADDLLVQESYEKAKEEYQLALNVFTVRPYPQEQITKIDALILKRDEYNQLIVLADALFKERNFEESLSNYKQALSIIPEKEYPQKKITEIETLLAAIAMTRAAYEDAIKKGDLRFAAQEYQLAKDNYTEALNQLSTEVYPRQKIMEIDQILQDLARKRMQFDKVIAQADASFKEQSYDMALGKYTSALEILPEEVYPQQKIDEIRILLSQIADQQTRYESLVAQGDQAFVAKDYASCISLFEQAMAIYPQEKYPPIKMAEARKELELIQRELDIAYQKAINEADKNFTKRKWDDSKIAYQQASDIKPVELYPKERLAKINSILEEELKKQQKEYDRYIADGERFYSTKYYQESIISFEKALTVFPYEKYPAEMIDKIFELIKKNSMLSILDSKVKILNKQEEKFTFQPIAFRDRKENYILLEIKVLNPEEQVKLYVNFGQGGSQNGGYSIHLKNKDGYHSYFVNIGKQPRWVSNDNDYLSILPEGGDVEVKLIKLSRNGI